MTAPDYETTFRRAVSDSIVHAKCATPEESVKAFNDACDRIVAAATVWADEREADQPAPDGSEGCMGPCCGGTP